MSYFVRLFSNLNENTIVNFLIPHLIAVLGLLTAGMIYLAVLIYRTANPEMQKTDFFRSFYVRGRWCWRFELFWNLSVSH